ncbi:MAG: hypothetical protein QF441_07175 [Bacteriovoracaceae bacterium]|jgi:hypothetical protein|nr:hypothetical protein [Halobacteriovoraceae bacterium]MDP7320375.1 hypothetical protein [Bacteriovoracaceae bacterium]
MSRVKFSIGILLIFFSPLFAYAQALEETVDAVTKNIDQLNSPQLQVSCGEKAISRGCPAVLKRQVDDATYGGYWGFINRLSLEGSGSPAQICGADKDAIRSEFFQKFPHERLEKILATDNRTSLDASISEVYPGCLEELNDLPDSNQKKKLLISSYYLGKNLINDETELYLRGISGIDALLGNDSLEDINCAQQSSEYIQNKCNEVKGCSSLSDQQRKETVDMLTQETLPVAKEVHELENQLKMLELVMVANASKPQNSERLQQQRAKVTELKSQINYKKSLFPWIAGKVFQESVASELRNGSLSNDDIKEAILKQLTDNKEELKLKLTQANQMNECLDGVNISGNCDNYEQNLAKLNSFQSFQRKIKTIIPQGNLTPSQTDNLKDKLAMESELELSQCILNERIGRDKFHQDSLWDAGAAAVTVALSLVTAGSGGALIATGSRAVTYAIRGGQLSVLASSSAYSASRGLHNFSICKEEFDKLSSFQSSAGLCASASNAQLFKAKLSYNRCVQEAVVSMSVGAIPIAASSLVKLSKMAKNSTALSRTGGSVQVNTSKYYTLKEVQDYRKMAEGEKILDMASKASGKEKADLFKRAGEIRDEVGEIDMARYQAYKRDYLSNPSGRVLVGEGSERDWNLAVEQAERRRRWNYELAEADKQRLAELRNKENRSLQESLEFKRLSDELQGIEVEEIPMSPDAGRIFGIPTELTQEQIERAILNGAASDIIGRRR